MNQTLHRRQWLRISAAVAASLSLSGRGRLAADETPPKLRNLLVRSENPLNAEPALAQLATASLTPVEQFYIRNHGPIPKVDAAGFRIKIEGLIHNPQELSLAQLKESFPQHAAQATLTCAGNRRREMSQIKPVGGVQWDAGAIGHASWSGAMLSDVLAAAELQAGAKHVWFEGLDPIKEKDGSVAPFGGSIPLERAIDKSRPALLAHAMNDKPLTAEHGAPLRTLVPGYIGARSVKWLTKITVSDRPSPNHYVAEAYKIVQSDAKEEAAKAEPIYEFPINAAICTPAAGEKLKVGQVLVGGYALPPGDGKSTISKVELSADGGKTWRTAELKGKAAPDCWQLWGARLTLPAGRHELVVRVTDSAGRLQLENCDWNFKGYLYNAWHRTSVEVA
jgi:sulfite oxidase